MTTFTDPFASSTEIPTVPDMAFDRSLDLRQRVRQLLGSNMRGKRLRDAVARAIGDALGAEGCALVVVGPKGPLFAGGGVIKQPASHTPSGWREPAPEARAWFVANAGIAASDNPAPGAPLGSAILVTPLHDPAAALVGALILVRQAPFTPDDERLMAAIAPEVAATCALPPRPAPRSTQASITAQQESALTFFQATSEAAVLIDDRFVIRAGNPAFARLVGQEHAVMGHTCQEQLRCSDAQDVPLCGTTLCPLFNAQLPNSASSSPTTSVAIVLPGGQRRQVTVRAVALAATTGQPDRLLILQPDQTSASQSPAHDAFLSDVAHKLRNHLNSIHGFVEMVANGFAGPIAPRQSELLSYAHASSIDLMEYIENLLLLTHADHGMLSTNLDAIHPQNLLEEAAQYLELEATAAHVQVICDAPAKLPTVAGDHPRLRQAVMNLLTNAIKYTEPQGKIRLVATALPDAIAVTVADTGIGIAPEDVPHIFTRGYQSQRTARLGKNGGGLGLAAAQVIITQHGGTLTCASRVGEGTTFTIRLPSTPPAAQ